MSFTLGSDKDGVDVLLKRRSVAILQGDARYLYKHGIAARKSDKVGDRIIKRGTRISLTYRKIK